MNTSPLRSPARLQRSRSSSATKRTSQNMHLPGLPRFHPANYPSAPHHTSDAPSPVSSYDSNTGSSSLRPQSPLYRQHPDHHHHHAQQQHLRHAYYRPSPLSSTDSSTGKLRPSRPNSPRLDPLGSPGPVTPFELEGDEYMGGYLGVRSGSHKSLTELAKMEDPAEFDEDVEVGQGGVGGMALGMGGLGRVRPISRPGTPGRS